MSKLVVIRNKNLVASHGHGIRLPISFATMITDSVVADPGFPRLGGANLLFFMKVHKNEPKLDHGGVWVLAPPPPPGSTNAV